MASANATRLIALDPGSIRTGFGILDIHGPKISYVSSGVMLTPVEAPFATRLLSLRLDFEELIKKYKPDSLAIESLFFSKNAQSALKLGHARGVLISCAAASQLPILEYTPAEVKKSVAGSGRGSKDQIEKMVKLLLKLPLSFKFKYSDESDALAIGLTHAQTYFFKGKLNRDRTSRWKTSS